MDEKVDALVKAVLRVRCTCTHSHADRSFTCNCCVVRYALEDLGCWDPPCTCRPAGPSLDHSDTCPYEQWRKRKPQIEKKERVNPGLPDFRNFSKADAIMYFVGMKDETLVPLIRWISEAAAFERSNYEVRLAIANGERYAKDLETGK